MYGGPQGFGDPNYRELSKMEEDPMIPQRMRDITRTQLCRDEVKAFADCSKENGFSMVIRWERQSKTIYSFKNTMIQVPGCKELYDCMSEGVDGETRVC